MKCHNGKYGSYAYLDIESQLKRFINPETYPSSTIKVFSNVDGIKVFKKTYNENKDCMLPILLKIITMGCKNKVFMVAAFYGTSKPHCQNEFMQDFVTEINQLISLGVTIPNKS